MMSEFHVKVIRLPERLGKHPNADTLGIAHVLGAYPVIFKSGDFQPGQLVTYVPVDSLVDTTRPEFAWLADPQRPTKTHHRVKARRLRGIFSMGLLVPAPAGTAEGDNAQEALGIVKWEPTEEINAMTSGVAEGAPPINWPVYDLEGLRRYPHLIKPGEAVVVTEKIHGCNARYTWQRDPDTDAGRLFVGSRTQFKRHDSAKLTIWHRAAERYKLAEGCQNYPGYTFYGEVFGHKVQDLSYGGAPGEVFFRLFDVRLPDGRYADWDTLVRFAVALGVQHVPVVYRGPYNPEVVAQLAEGPTTMTWPGQTKAGDHTREGVVIQLEDERNDPDIGRVKLKLVGEGYLLR